jgi:uncharacterized protein
VTIVSDAGPIIHLSLISQLDLLPALYGRILIPEQVYQEVVVQSEDLPGSSELRSTDWADLVAVDTKTDLFRALTTNLDLGESAALCLALDRRADLILCDDLQARLAAEKLGLRVKGTLGVLMEAKRKRRLPLVGPFLLELRRRGVWLSDSLVNRVLQESGEEPAER